MQLEKTIEATIEFLKIFGRLNDPKATPDFGTIIPIQKYDVEHMKSVFGNDQESMYEELGAPIRYANTTAEEFNRINQLENLNLSEFEQKIMDSIPNNSEFAIVDTGSDLGRDFTRPFAEKHPNVKIYMVDCFGIKHLEEDYVYKSDKNPKGFSKRIVLSDDVEESMNRLLQANDFHNILYIHKNLSTQNSTNIPELEQQLKGKRVIFTGWKNPGNIGFVTNKEAYTHNAEYIFSTWTALERIKPDDHAYKMLRTFLRNHFSDAEFAKFTQLVHDGSDTHISNPRYDYSDDGQKAFATALKQLLFLAGCDDLKKKGFDVKLFYNPTIKYNQSDHIIYAFKKDNILKL